MRRAPTLAWMLAIGIAAALAVVLLIEPPAERRHPIEPEPDLLDPGSPRTEPLRAEGGQPAGATGESRDDAGTAEAGGGFLQGVVVDPRERGIPDARVQLFPVDPRGLRGAPYPDGERLAETRTERDGSFRLPAPAGTWLRLVASAPGRATVGVLVPAAGARVVLRLPPASRLTVDVRDEADRPVPGARVRVQVEDSRAEGESAADGSASFDSLPPGSAWVRAGAAGHGTVRAGPLTLRSAAAAEVTVVLTPGVQLAGTVLDGAQGTPVAGADVVVARPGESDRAQPTGADGRFGPLPAGGRGQRVFVAVRAEGYAPLLEPVILHGPGVQSIQLRLARAAPWRGTVRTPDGRPAAGARVAYTDDGVAGLGPASTLADEQGQFGLPPPPPPAPGRRVVLFARHPAGVAALALRPAMLAPDPLVLTLAAGSRVSGRVVDAQGRALSGVQIRLTPAWERIPSRPHPDAATSLVLLANETGFLELAAASAGDGGWALDAVPGGPYEVRFRWPAGQHWRAEVLEVAGAGVSAGTERLGAGFTLAGRLVDGASRPVAGASVRVLEPARRARARRATTDADGGYEVQGLPAGTYRVRASIGAFDSVEIEVPVVGDVFDADLALADGAVLEGRVSHGERAYDGLLTLSLRPGGAGGAPRPPHHLRARDGTFRWEGVPTGAWVVEAHAPGGLRASTAEPVEIEAGRIASAALALVTAAQVEGVVTTSRGDPVPGARVTLRADEDGRRQLATADERGGFRLTGLAAGRYRVDAWGRGGAPAGLAFDLEDGEERTVALRLAPAGRLRVEVVDAQGHPAAGAVVLFATDAGALPAERPDRAGRDGVVLREDLPLEAVTVRARDAQGREGRARARVEAGRTAQVRVRLDAAPPR